MTRHPTRATALFFLTLLSIGLPSTIIIIQAVHAEEVGQLLLKEQLARELAERNFNLAIINLLNFKYITDADNGVDFNANTALVYMALGRRYTASITVNF